MKETIMTKQATNTRLRPDVHLHIDGKKIAHASGGTFDHIDPATGVVDKTIPMAGKLEVDQAVDAAERAFTGWRRTPPTERRDLLLKLADLISENSEEFAQRAAMDVGTPLDVGRGFGESHGIGWTRYYAGWADKIGGGVTSHLLDTGDLSYSLKQPYGVIGMVITWNGPLPSLCMKVPAALAAGNTVVVKPSELSPFTASLFADLVAGAGFPPGVVNILVGDAEAGRHLLEHPGVAKISFTGGVETARDILSRTAKNVTPSLMELGGKSANIVFDDADLDSACVFGASLTIQVLSGQGCSFPTRMLVHRLVYEPMLDRITAYAESIKVGNPLEEGTNFGPVVNKAAQDRILGMIDEAQRDGARLLTGGKAISREGFYVEPTVLADVDPKSRIAQEEVFGPVLVVTPFDDEDEAIRMANGTPFGLAAYVNTRDIARALRSAELLEAGLVVVNGADMQPAYRSFGGRGLSGFGKEGGREGLDEFLFDKAVGISGL